MDKTSVLAIFALVITLNCLVEGMDPAQTKKCLKETKRTLKKMMKMFHVCNEKLKFHEISGEEYTKKIGCVVKCVMQSVDVLDANDMMTEETLKKSIEATAPPEFVQVTHESLMTCVKEHPLDPKDEMCKSYLDMGTCMQGVVVDICGEPPMM